MYLGRVYFNASQHDDAMTSFLIAAECVDEVDDHKLIGLLYPSISEVYFADYNFFRGLILVMLTPQPSMCVDIGLKRLVVITGLLFIMRAIDNESV